MVVHAELVLMQWSGLDEEKNWAWNLYSLTSDVGQPIITNGATYLPVGDHSVYTVNGLFREIPGVNLTSFGPNYAGRITDQRDFDPWSIEVTWNVRTTGASVYATTTNNCGDQQPAYRQVTVY